jgi:hypothetical protein
LLAVINTVTQLEDHSRSLDECGSRYMVAVKMHQFLKSARQIPEKEPLAIEDVVWALHSNSQDTLLQMYTPYSLFHSFVNIQLCFRLI